MEDKELRPRKVKSAPRGSKKGWRVVSGQVPPDTRDAFDRQLEAREIQETDAVREAVEQWLGLEQQKAAA